MNIIVQAGGRGSRLRHHTWNKPKCLVSVRGKPILYHLFDAFPDAHFYIIGDYQYDQLEAYLNSNSPGIEYTLIHATDSGTASGIQQAISQMPKNQPVLLTWSDIIINQFEYPLDSGTTVYLTDAFACRWSFDGDKLVEETSDRTGVPGIFWFDQAEVLDHLPNGGEFVKWFSQNIFDYTPQLLSNIEELGDFATIESDNDSLGFCRFFNSVQVHEHTVTKQAIDPEYQHLVTNEVEWYQKVRDLGFKRIPQILEYPPLVMSRISGKHVWEYENLTELEQRSLLADILYTLQDLHSRGHAHVDTNDIKAVYVDKTKKRVHEVSKLIPGFDRDSVTVNGVKCPNVFHEKHQHLWDTIEKSVQTEYFSPIHGDPTFSNTLIDHNLKSWFIDPRGYFAHDNDIYGDPDYDFAKVYYSAVGGYDTFNRRKFKLFADGETAEIIMSEPATAGVAETVFQEFFDNKLRKIKIAHGLIWLALSGYARDDIDSVIGSFYLGLYYLKQGLDT